MTESQKSLFLRLASEMVLGKGMPPEWIGDWENIGKATPMKTKRHIEATAKESLRQCREWSKRIMAVVDAEKSR